MSINYYIDLNCRPRETLGGPDLLDKLRRWIRALSVKQEFQQQQPGADESDMQFEETTTAEDGSQEKTVTSVAEVRTASADLEALSQHCTECPAALTNTPYSCIQALGFPISQAAEQWLLDSVADPESRSGAIMASALDALQSPAGLDGWRKAGLLEATTSLERVWGDRTIQGDQLFQMLFLAGDWMPNHTLGLLLGFQFLTTSDGRKGDDVLQLIAEVQGTGNAGDAPSLMFQTGVTKDSDPSIIALAQMLYAGYIAFSLQCPLAIRG